MASLADEPIIDKRVLVTGGTGFIGSHVAMRLEREGAVVGLLARNASRNLPSRGSFQAIDCDLRDAAATPQLIAEFRPEVILHFAAQADGREHFGQSHACLDTNLGGVINLLEGLRLCGSGTLVYGDSCKVYGNADVPYRESTPTAPASSYAIAKVAGWQFCQLYQRLHGLRVVSVRPTLIFGPRQKFNLVSCVVDCVMKGKDAINLDGGRQTRDPLYIDDAVEAWTAVVRRHRALSGRVINIGGGMEIAVADIARTILELMGADIPIVEAPEQARPTEMWRSYCDNAEAEQALAWRPKVDLREGLRRTIDHLLACSD